MVEIRDGAVIHRGKDIVAFMGRADGLELSIVFFAVARRTEQGRKSAACTCAIGDNLVRIPCRQAMAVIAQITHGRFIVDNQRGSFAHIRRAVIADRRAAADGRSRDDVALGKCDKSGIRPAGHAVVVTRLCNLSRHIAAHAVRQENRRGLGCIAVNGAALAKIFLRNENAHGFRSDRSRLRNIRNIAVRAKGHSLSIELQRFFRVILGIELQAVFLLFHSFGSRRFGGHLRCRRRRCRSFCCNRCLRLRISGSGLCCARCKRDSQRTDSQHRQNGFLQIHIIPSSQSLVVFIISCTSYRLMQSSQ